MSKKTTEVALKNDLKAVSTDIEKNITSLSTKMEEYAPLVDKFNSELLKVEKVSDNDELEYVKGIIASSKSINKNIDEARLEATRHIDNFKKQIIATVEKAKLDETVISIASSKCDEYVKLLLEEKRKEEEKIQREKDIAFEKEQLSINAKSAMELFIKQTIHGYAIKYITVVDSLTEKDIDERYDKFKSLSTTLDIDTYKKAIENIPFNHSLLSNQEAYEIIVAHITQYDVAKEMFDKSYAELKSKVEDSIKAKMQSFKDSKTTTLQGNLAELASRIEADVNVIKSQNEQDAIHAKINTEIESQFKMQTTTKVDAKVKLKSYISKPRIERTLQKNAEIYGMLCALYLSDPNNDDSKLDFLLSYLDKVRNGKSYDNFKNYISQIPFVEFKEDVKA